MKIETDRNSNGEVRYGLDLIDGLHVPVIEITNPIGERDIVFKANGGFQSEDEGRLFVVAVYKILSGKQNNFKYDRSGAI